jgi:hypothetical protein
METSIPTSSIHLGGLSDYPLKAPLFKMSSIRHFPDDAGKGQKLLVLAAQ